MIWMTVAGVVVMIASGVIINISRSPSLANVGMVGIVIGAFLLVLSLLIYGIGHARAATLPMGITCAQVVQYAGDLKIPNTFAGRMQARAIALTFGHWLSNAELRAAAACLRQAEAGQR